VDNLWISKNTDLNSYYSWWNNLCWTWHGKYWFHFDTVC